MSRQPDGPNTRTLRSYEAHVQNYIGATPASVAGAMRDWIDTAVSGLPATAKILELGSGGGRDAAYLARKGFSVDCTDAAAGFVAHLRTLGFAARRLDILMDTPGEDYDLILANAVLLHFGRDDFVFILEKLRGALAPGGRFAFSLKTGDGEEWSERKIGAPRFFCYWRREMLGPLLEAAGFATWRIGETQPADWLYVIARAPS